MTIRKRLLDAKEVLAEFGMMIGFCYNSGEYRVNFKGGSEDTAYYTSDINDAISTAKQMGQRLSATLSV